MLILASRSASRQAMLTAAGIPFEARPADVDERALEATLAGAAAPTIARTLAEVKALAVPEPGALVLGSDSLVEAAGRRFSKPRDRAEAAAHLRTFSGQAMTLASGAALARDGRIVWRHAEIATLTVRDLSDGFIERYLDAEWPAVAGCVGVFRIETLGIQLFEQIEGSHFTVLGMPLLPVLTALRAEGALPA